jgi:hypothetical protein
LLTQIESMVAIKTGRDRLPGLVPDNVRLAIFLALIAMTLVGCATSPPPYRPTLSDGWSLVHSDVNKRTYSINLRNFTVSSTFPRTVSFPLFQSGSTTYDNWEVYCGSKQIKVNNLVISVGSETTTVRRQILDGVCGVQSAGVTWALVGANFDSATALVRDFFLIDFSSLERIEEPFQGVLATISHASLQGARITPGALSEILLDCRDPSRFGARWKGVEKFDVRSNASLNSFPHSLNSLVCSNKFPIREMKREVQPPPTKAEPRKVRPNNSSKSNSAPPTSSSAGGSATSKGSGVSKADRCKRIGLSEGSADFDLCIRSVR